MHRRLPPFAAIRAFEAAARHGSIKNAAEELCLTPSAVSHQVKALEEFLSTQLLNRDNNRLSLTLTGRTYFGKLGDLLDMLDESTRQARGEAQDLRVLCTPGFAARWLVPRLPRFDFGATVRLRVSVGAPDTDFARNDADVVIHWSDTPVDGLVVEPLMASTRYPVIAPALRDSLGIATPSDLARCTLLHDEVMDAWADWFTIAGVPLPDLPRGPRYPNCEYTTTAAEQGQGVALAYDAMVRGTLANGSLVRLFDPVTLPIVIYSVAYREDRADHPAIRAFRDWIFDEALRDGIEPPRSDLRTAAE